MTFNKKAAGALVTYKLETDLIAELAETIALDLKQELEKSPKIESVVFDLQANDIHHKAFKVLAPLGLELRKSNKKMYALTDKKSVLSLIKLEGMGSVITPIENMDELKTEVPSAKKTGLRLDVSFVNPFVEGTMHVLKVQCKTQISPLKPILKSKGDFKCRIDIAGIIGLTSQSFQGSIAICFPSEVYLSLMSRMLGEEFQEITDDLKDGAGELTNMIFGHAKKVLNANGHTIEKALPSVIRGPNVQIDHPGATDSIILPFDADGRIFYMEIGTEQN